MVPLTRKPSFPPPAPPSSHCQQKRNFRLTPEDLQLLQLQPPADILQPRPTMHGPEFLLERPSSPLPRTPSPSLSSEFDVDIIEQFPLPIRLRCLSENLLPESRGRPPPSPPPSIAASASASASTSASANLSVPWTVYGATVATAAISRSPSPRPASHPNSYHEQPRGPSPPLPPPKSQPPGHRSKFHPRAVLGFSKAARHSNPQLSEASAPPETGEGQQQLWLERGLRTAQERGMGEIAHQSLAPDRANEIIQTRITALLQGRLPPGEDRISTLSACARACERGGLDFSTVLQETLIEGHPPIYWAIINRDVASGSRGLEPDSLIAAILAACRPLSPASLAAIRVACTMASDNVLLQELFRLIPPLSHISTRDALLLSPANEEDRVDIEEKRNGTGSWVALIKIPRFRLRMRVCGSVSVEFIASGRMWILTFSAVTETLPGGRTENRWYLSLQLEGQSPPTAVNATFLILGTPGATEDNYSDELARSIQLCPPMSELSPGHDKGISVRLDDGPIGPYLLNESSLLVDSNKALHAKLTQSTVPSLVTDTSSGSSYSVEPQTPGSDITYIPAYHHPPRPSNPPPLVKFLPPAGPRSSAGSPPPDKKKKKKKKRNENYVSLRRGGR